MSLYNVSDEIAEDMMNKPAGRRFFRRAGAVIQSSGAIDTARNYLVNHIVAPVVFSIGIVVQNAGLHIAKIDDVIEGFRSIGVNITHVNNFRATIRHRHKKAEKIDENVDDEKESKTDAITEDGDVEDVDEDGVSVLTTETSVSHRSKSGVVAQRQVRNLQRSNRLLIQRTPFCRAVRRIASELFPSDDEESTSILKFSDDAILLLQTTAESALLNVVAFAYDVTLHSKRKEVNENDMEFAISHLNINLC